VHSGVAAEAALQTAEQLERLLLLALAPVALGQLELEARLARRDPDDRLVLLERLILLPEFSSMEMSRRWVSSSNGALATALR
jgi:hypothetical protein